MRSFKKNQKLRKESFKVRRQKNPKKFLNMKIYRKKIKFKIFHFFSISLVKVTRYQKPKTPEEITTEMI